MTQKPEFVYALPSGTTGQISLQRLIEVLRQSGEIKKHETVTHMSVSNGFLKYRVELK